MISTYQSGANNTTGGTTIGAANVAVEIFKVIIGVPVNSGNIWLFSITNPGGTTNTNLLAKLTMGGTVSESTQKVFDFTDNHGNGMLSENGANLMIDQTMQVTVEWDYAQNPEGHE